MLCYCLYVRDPILYVLCCQFSSFFFQYQYKIHAYGQIGGEKDKHGGSII